MNRLIFYIQKWFHISLFKKLNLAKAGFTLTELMMSIAIIAVITPAVTMLMVMTMRSFTSYEAEMQLRLTNQATLNRIYLRLGSCKRIYDGAADPKYLQALDLQTSPTPIGGSTSIPNASCVLPIINSAGTLAQGTSSFVNNDVGNCLFFANNDSMPSVLGGTSTVKIDVYRFNFYYLTTQNPKPIPASIATCYSLVEWQSVQFADYDELISITDSNWQKNAIIALFALGIQNAWDANSSAVGSSFYTLTSVGGINAATGGAHTISARPPSSAFSGSPIILTKMPTGIMFGGFSYGVSSNSAQWTGKYKCPKLIPQFANAGSNPFPSGFEVAIAGQSAGRSVLVRSVLVAQGSMPSVIGDDLEIVAMARDVW